MEEIIELIKKRINSKKEIIIIMDGETGCGMSYNTLKSYNINETFKY